MKYALINTLISAPPGGRFSHPNTFPKRIGLIVIYTCIKFEQNQMKTVGVVVFLVNCLHTEDERRTTNDDDDGPSMIGKAHFIEIVNCELFSTIPLSVCHIEIKNKYLAFY